MSEEEGLGKRGILLHVLVESLGSPGIVVDADVAARTGCKCYQVEDTLMCFSKGVIGTLSKPQVEAYCKTKEVITEGGMVERIKRFKEAAAEAHKEIEKLPKGERLEKWLEEMGKALTKRGIEV